MKESIEFTIDGSTYYMHKEEHELISKWLKDLQAQINESLAIMLFGNEIKVVKCNSSL